MGFNALHDAFINVENLLYSLNDSISATIDCEWPIDVGIRIAEAFLRTALEATTETLITTGLVGACDSGGSQ